MSFEELLHKTVDDFLTEHRNNLLEDRQSVTALLKEILQEQQTSEVENTDQCEETLLSSPEEVEQNKTEESTIVADSKIDTNTEHSKSHSSEHPSKSREFNSQIEKERLAELFENAPHALRWSYRKKRESPSGRRRKNSNYDFQSENKENLPLNSDREKTTVRYGEFSPLNPAFRSEKKVLGLGDYEQLRKTFLEKKKSEYVQYFRNDNVRRILENSCSENTSRLLELRLNSNQPEELSSENRFTTLSFPVISSEDKKIMSSLKKCQQAAYRRELDKQIEEKKRKQQAEKESERRECEMWSHQEMQQRENLMKDIEKKFCERIQCKNLNNGKQTSELHPNREGTQHLPSPSHVLKFKKNQRENSIQVTACRQSPILKPTTEACAVDNYEEYKRMQRELYKRELAEQIEEKKKLERERKLKEMEIERKIEENVRKEEEKSRLQYEKELAERNYRATQKAQIDKQLQDNLCRIKKQNEDKKKIKKVTSPEACLTYSTNNQVHEKPKNVTFASHALMHCIPVDHSQKRKSRCFADSDEERDYTTEATIVQAPYVLAIKDGFNNNNSLCVPISARSRSPSPVLPAVRTRNLINALPKTDNVEIPAGVSMSEQARTRFIKDERILSNLSEIRRKLLEDQCKNSCNNN